MALIRDVILQSHYVFFAPPIADTTSSSTWHTRDIYKIVQWTPKSLVTVDGPSEARRPYSGPGMALFTYCGYNFSFFLEMQKYISKEVNFTFRWKTKISSTKLISKLRHRVVYSQTNKRILDKSWSQSSSPHFKIHLNYTVSKFFWPPNNFVSFNIAHYICFVFFNSRWILV